MTRRLLLWVGLAAAVIAFGVGAEIAAGAPRGLALAIADLVVGLLLLGFGAAALVRQPGSRTGVWLGVAGLAWFLGTIGWPFVGLHRGLLVLLLLAYPSGRLPRGWPTRAVVGAALVISIVPALAHSDRLTVALGALVALAALRMFLGSGGIARSAAAPALLAAVAFAGILSLGAGLRLGGVHAERPVLWFYDLVIAALAAVLLVDLLRARWSESVLRGLVVDLGALRGPATLQQRIARALGDPTVRVGAWDGAVGAYADESGAPLSPPADGSGLVTTQIDADGSPLALIVHDSAALGDEALLASVAAVARTAVTNASLEAQIEEQAREITASRRRLVEAADGERRALQRTIVQGPERRLRHVSELVAQAAADGIATGGPLLQREIDAAIDELIDLADGVRPADLVGGLHRALPALAARSPLDVSTVVMVGRLPDAVEAAAYFVCSEALANAAKHAHATSARIEATTDSGVLRLIVADEGVGGADTDGAGLRGLADRVEALGGRLRIESSPGTGTRVLVKLPYGPD